MKRISTFVSSSPSESNRPSRRMDTPRCSQWWAATLANGSVSPPAMDPPGSCGRIAAWTEIRGRSRETEYGHRQPSFIAGGVALEIQAFHVASADPALNAFPKRTRGRRISLTSLMSRATI
jgi:hypothetical protein